MFIMDQSTGHNVFAHTDRELNRFCPFTSAKKCYSDMMDTLKDDEKSNAELKQKTEWKKMKKKKTTNNGKNRRKNICDRWFECFA